MNLEKAIYLFESGYRIDLSKLLCIAAIEKDEFNRIVLPLYFENKEKPINIVMAHAIQFATVEQKMRVQQIVEHVTRAWDEIYFRRLTNLKFNIMMGQKLVEVQTKSKD